MKRLAFLAAIMLCLPAAMCQTTGAYPRLGDVQAVTDAKPLPPADALTDPAAGDLYDSDVEAWGDRLRAAGLRMCRFYQRTGMPGVDCPKD